MAAAHKHRVTGTSHPLPFDQLSPLDFERLCLWLVGREGFEGAEHLGASGSEQGRDVVAWRGGRRVVFQCKRVKAFSGADALREIAKLRALPAEEQPHELVFVVNSNVSADARKAAREAWGDGSTCEFWVGTELDERVKRHPDVAQEFFQIPVDRTRESLIQNLGPSLRDNFNGRDAELLALREALLAAPAGRATAIACKAIHGLGGVGKTRLAIEYAWKSADDYAALFFVGAGTPADLQRNLAALAEAHLLDLPQKDAPEEPVRVEAVLAWLRQHSGWLLILDNVDDEAAAVAVEELVESLHGGHVLLTGRLARWGANIEAIELDVLSEPAAVEFLLTRTDKRRRRTGDDDACVKEIAKELGCLPLALEQAAAYIAERALSFAGYLEEWKRRRDKVLEWYDARVMNYPASVAVTWLTSVERLSARARRLLDRLAWLALDPIPETLLDVAIPGVEEEGDAARDAVAELAAYSLVTRSREEPATFWVHRLVQEVSRRWQERAEERGALEETLKWMGDGFVGDAQDVRSWPVLEPLAPHARALAERGFDLELGGPTAGIFNDLGALLLSKASYAEAEPLVRRALEIDERSLGADHPLVAVRLNNLATLFQATNRLPEAELLLRRALEIDTSSFELGHFLDARLLNNLAWLLQGTNRLLEAELLMRRALEINELSFGTDHPNVAVVLNNLAQLLQTANRLSEAEPVMLRALEIDERSFGANHPTVAIRLNNLAALLHATDRMSEAEPLMRRVVGIWENQYGADHPNVATALNNLASLLHATNRLTEAEPLARRALDIDERSFEVEHPVVATDLNNLARLLQDMSRLQEAEPLMRRSVSIFAEFKRCTGHDHPDFQAGLANYKLLLEEMGKTGEEVEATLNALLEE